jgi:type 1 glutamine amidotransferase
MARPTALLIAGGADYHNTPEHYELLSGLLAGPAGLNLTITDDFAGLTDASVRPYDLLVLWATIGDPPAAPVEALFGAVRRGTPLLGIHAAPFTVRRVPGGPEAIGALYLPWPHLPYQETTVSIYDRSHPITRNVEDFRVTDELYCLEPRGDGVQVLAGYDGRAADAPYRGAPRPGQDEAHAWRLGQPRAPLLYTTRLGAGKVHVNALGHDGAALRHPAFRQLIAQGVGWLLDR